MLIKKILMIKFTGNIIINLTSASIYSLFFYVSSPLMDRFAKLCTVFELTHGLKTTNVLAQVATPPNITIDNYQLEVVHKFMYLASTITNKLYFDKEIHRRIGKLASTLAHLGTRVCMEKPSYSTSNNKCLSYAFSEKANCDWDIMDAQEK